MAVTAGAMWSAKAALFRAERRVAADGLDQPDGVEHSKASNRSTAGRRMVRTERHADAQRGAIVARIVPKPMHSNS
jgi:hypothetical protein